MPRRRGSAALPTLRRHATRRPHPREEAVRAMARRAAPRRWC
ncbi:hypothetical protein [Solirubrobacter ginsenosidimutans]|nr:hypothetical protein [Solirubrobacter ginsenosidimutans]